MAQTNVTVGTFSRNYAYRRCFAFFLLSTDSQDFGDVWRKAYSMENFTSVCEDLWRQVKPLYQQLHAYVRRKLMGTYSNNSRDFPCNRQIPAHILGE